MKALYFNQQAAGAEHQNPQGIIITSSSPVLQANDTPPSLLLNGESKEGMFPSQSSVVIVNTPTSTDIEIQSGVTVYFSPVESGTLNIMQPPTELSNLQKLREALTNRDLEKVKEIVNAEEIDIINDTSEGSPILFQALSYTDVCYSHQEREKSDKILEFLLDIKGVDPHVTSSSGSSLLFCALIYQNRMAADKLMALGANAVLLKKDYTLSANNQLFVEYICQNNKKAADLLAALRQEQVDSVSISNELKSMIADGDKPILQAVVTKGGKDLLKVLNNSGEFKQIKKGLTEHGIKYSAKYQSGEDGFIITSTYYQDESKTAFNIPEMKEKSKAFFKDGKIYSAQTNQVIKKVENAIYAMSKKGTLYINLEESNFGKHHSFFLKGKPGDSLFGYGKPVASAGHTSIEEGKITKFNGNSGHFDTTPDQIKVALYYLVQQDVLADKVDVMWYDRAPSRELFEDFASWYSNVEESLTPWKVIGDILDKYAEVIY